MRYLGRMTRALIGLISLVGGLLVLIATGRNGIGISPDAVVYLYAAKLLVSGNGFVGYFGEPVTFWPPMFPTLLASVHAIGFDPVLTWPHVNAVLYVLICFLAGSLIHEAAGFMNRIRMNQNEHDAH